MHANQGPRTRYRPRAQRSRAVQVFPTVRLVPAVLCPAQGGPTRIYLLLVFYLGENDMFAA
eukprot:4147054-Karenia_brevis.AAC.1